MKMMTKMKGKIEGYAIRVPVPDGSSIDICATVSKKVTTDEVNEAFKKASENSLKGILEYTTEPLVSIDIIGNPHSCIFDPALTTVIGNTVKIVGWYDNDAGYSSRLVDLILYLDQQAGKN